MTASNLPTIPNGFPGVPSIHEFHLGTDALCNEGAPLPEIDKRNPTLSTWRVVQRDTGAALRRGFESLVRFGQPHLFIDQLAEFPTKDAAESAIHYVMKSGRFSVPFVMEAREVIHMGGGARLNEVLCHVRDTAVEQAWADMRITDPTLRGLAALRPFSTKGGW